MTPLLLATLLASATAQEERPSVQDVIKEVGPTIRAIEGVIDVAAGGTAEDPRILVRLASEEAKTSVSQKIGGNVRGYRFFFYVAPPAGQTVVAPAIPPEATRPPPKRTEAEKAPESVEDCDILRDHLKLKPVTHHKDGKTITGCQLLRRSRLGGGGGHSFWYTRHRLDCPVRSNRVAKPAKADEFTTWVFTRGFQPASQGSFLVFELKGSDKSWFDGVKDDLTALLPYIREGARWIKADKEDAGAGWIWQVRND